MIPIIPWCTLGEPLPYITGSYYKATTFVIENNVIPLEYAINIVKRPPLWQGMDPPLRYMYIVVQCGLSSIVEYGATIYVVDCVKRFV
jgi:hypothetical protein